MPAIEFPPEFSFGMLTFGPLIFASIWWLIYLMCRDHRAILKELRSNSAETVLSKANSFRASNTADLNAIALNGLVSDIGSKIDAAVGSGVAQIAATAVDVAERLAEQTPAAGTVMPDALRVALEHPPHKSVEWGAPTIIGG